ncbi:hypothetical protein [Pedobacter frigoris]|uniref:hypothetical protein n=1 Tax=Pedobacter frigoris TaxID=2571272 RepID=UPI00292DA3ED|nr:hypothetical protein [Pedobacter frigoris]
MRGVIVFVLFLSFQLLKGNDTACAGVHQNSNKYSPAQQIKKQQPARLGSENPGFPVVKNTNLSEQKEEFVTLEDENDDLVFSRKYVLAAKFFITLAYASVLVYFYQQFKNRLPFCKHLSYTSSYKYILQRVLRL